MLTVKPFYENEAAGVVLYCGDCREVLPTLGVHDLLLTDPPYGLGKKWNSGAGTSKSEWTFLPSEVQQWDGAIAEGLPEMVRSFKECIVWGGNYYHLPPMRGWLVWDKKTNDQFSTSQAELAWTNLDKPVRVFRFAHCEQINEGKKLHPTQKPLALMEWCLKWVSGDHIADPFMGSGTTGVACVRLGRKFTGIEIDERYCEIAARRIQTEVEKGTLFDPRELEAAAPRQLAITDTP